MNFYQKIRRNGYEQIAANIHMKFFFFRDNYNMLLTPQLKLFPPYAPKHFVHREVPIQLQGLWLLTWSLIYAFFSTKFILVNKLMNMYPKKSIYGHFKLKKILLLNSPFHYFIKTKELIIYHGINPLFPSYPH